MLSALEKSDKCNETRHSHDHDHDHDHDHEDHDHNTGLRSNVYSYFERLKHMEKEVWIYSIVCVMCISVAGFVLVFLVSKLNETCRSFLTPFLVSLAVGCLCGDALLHLIPHVTYFFLI